jgi:hypothetical protein
MEIQGRNGLTFSLFIEPIKWEGYSVFPEEKCEKVSLSLPTWISVTASYREISDTPLDSL